MKTTPNYIILGIDEIMTRVFLKYLMIIELNEIVKKDKLGWGNQRKTSYSYQPLQHAIEHHIDNDKSIKHSRLYLPLGFNCTTGLSC